MNKSVIAAALAAIFPFHAVCAGELTPEKCKASYTIAEKIMEARQHGVPLPRMIEIAEGDALFMALTRQAYETPRFSSESYKRNKIQDFANEIYLICLRKMEEG